MIDRSTSLTNGFLFVLLHLLGISVSCAQAPSQTMTFANGTMSPIGDFARSKSIADRGAEEGVISEITYQYHPAKAVLGFVASGRFMGTTLDNRYPAYTFPGNAPFTLSGEGQLPTAIKGEGNINDPENYPGYSTRLHQAYLEAAAVMAGISYDLRLGKRWSLHEELQLGLSRMSLGMSTLKGSKPDTAQPGNDDRVYSAWENSTAYGFTGLGKIGLAFRMSREVAFFLNADYWYMHSKMTYYSRTIYSEGPAGSDPSSQPGLGMNEEEVAEMKGVMKNPSMIDIMFGIRVALKK